MHGNANGMSNPLLVFINTWLDKLKKLDKLDAIEQRIIKIEESLTAKLSKEVSDVKPIPQKAAIRELETTFPTFKKLCIEFRVKPIKRNGRLFYKSSDIQRMLNGLK